MHYPSWLEKSVISGFDLIYGAIPQSVPPPQALAEARVIAHRGQCDQDGILENTLAAFDRAVSAGVWGIEFDLRWTSDLIPVVHHDLTLERVFAQRHCIFELSREKLKELCAPIPTFEEVIERYRGRAHFMIELKEEHSEKALAQANIIKSLLSGLQPVRDYHFLSFQPRLFEKLKFAPPETFFPIAQLNAAALSQFAIENRLGGIMAQHGLISNSIIRRHLELGQLIATGFIDSQNVLKREIKRGVRWLFSNRSTQMQRFLEELRSTATPTAQGDAGKSILQG